jgi:hypothetical protein
MDEPKSVAYHPLDHSTDQFRLLCLKPATVTPNDASPDGLVTGELQHHCLSKAPPFVALSYCWGAGFDQKSVLINNTIQKCGAAGEAALRRLGSGQEMYVWIDQLCINQTDDAEKSHQVRLMLRIYVAASRVAVWMGPDGDDSGLLIPHIYKMSALIREGKFLDVVRSYTDVGFLQRMSNAFQAFCKREYWTRLWIIQEFAVARELDILCGGSSISDVDLREFLVFFNQLHQYFPIIQAADSPELILTLVQMMRGFFKTPSSSYLEGVFTRRRRYQTRFGLCPAGAAAPAVAGAQGKMIADGESLFAVLVTTLVLEIDYNHTKVTDDRDRIFAVMHFADDVDEFESLPDYTRGSQQIYQDVAQHMFEQGHIDLLSYCQFPRETPLATWTPDWRMGIKRPCVGNPWLSKFDASKGSASKQVVGMPVSGTMSLRGVLVDEVEDTGNVWDPNWVAAMDCNAAIAYIDEVEAMCAKSPRLSDKIKAQDLKDVMRICIADRYNYREPERQTELVQGFVEAAVRMNKMLQGSDQDTELGMHLEDNIGWQLPWFMFAMKNLHSRRPFTSKTGYVGLLPMHALVGDKVVIFHGGKTPYVIRPKANVYEVVGEAYVHGVMYGEFMAEDVPSTEFLLV